MNLKVPDTQLNFSPALAQEIGLEPAILVSILRLYRAQHRHSIDTDELLTLAPFWSQTQVLELFGVLKARRLIQFHTSAGAFRFQFIAPPPPPPTGAVAPWQAPCTVEDDWQPSPTTLQTLAQLYIPEDFALQQLPEFRCHAIDSGQQRPNAHWNREFRKAVTRAWRYEEARTAKKRREIPMHVDWNPSPQAIQTLQRGELQIPEDFWRECLPEFRIYWIERGATSDLWGSKFAEYVRRQWKRLTVDLARGRAPAPIADDWYPSSRCLELIDKDTLIDVTFAMGLVDEFRLYWQERGHALPSWDTVFLRWAKRRWQQRDEEPRLSDRSFYDRLTDLSWAEGLIAADPGSGRSVPPRELQ